MKDDNRDDRFSTIIEDAVQRGLEKVFNANAATNLRMLTVEASARYLACSKREIFYMIERGELRAVKHGRKTVLDVGDLDEWIAQAKNKSH